MMAAALYAHREVELVLEMKGSNTRSKMMWNNYSTTVEGALYKDRLTTRSSIISLNHHCAEHGIIILIIAPSLSIRALSYHVQLYGSAITGIVITLPDLYGK